jgi:osmotically-inducible protein OsmY
MKFRPFPMRALVLTLVAILTVPVLIGCASLLIGGAVVGTTLIATDRRSSGAQVEDKSIELKAPSRVKEAIGERGHINVNSYNRLVLITGEVSTAADQSAVEQAISRIENVKSIVNEVLVSGNTTFGSRSNDTFITSKVKATLIGTKDISSNAVKVVTERGAVYLMGRLTPRESDRVTDVVRSKVSGIQKVVRVFETITEEELAQMKPKGVR